jgi:hypothetical protein
MITATSTVQPHQLAQSTVAFIYWLKHCAKLLFGAISLFAVIPASADQRGADFTVAVEAIDYMPLYSGSVQSPYHGYARDLLDLFGRKFGYRFHYVALPVNRLYKEFFAGQQLDFKFPDNPNWQPENKAGLEVIYSAPVITVVEGLFLPAPKAGQGINDIKSIATITGFTPTPYLQAITSGKIKLYSVDSFQSLFTMSTIERVDAIYTNNLAVKYFESAHGSKDSALIMDRKLPSIASAFSLATLKHPDVVAQFNQFLQSDQVEIVELKRKYGIAAMVE